VWHRTEKDPNTGLTLPAWRDEDGNLSWFRDGRHHRADVDPDTGLTLPADVNVDGHREWFDDGYNHRVDKDPKTGLSLPAIDHGDGHAEWFVRGKRHREDGPALRNDDNDNTEYVWKGVRVMRADVVKNVSVIPWMSWALRGKLPGAVIDGVLEFAMPQIAVTEAETANWVTFRDRAIACGPDEYHDRCWGMEFGWEGIAERFIDRIRGAANDEDREDAVLSAVYVAIAWGNQSTDEKDEHVAALLEACAPYHERWWDTAVDDFIHIHGGSTIWAHLKRWCQLWGFDFARIQNRHKGIMF
jgi:hypothetical protein